MNLTLKNIELLESFILNKTKVLSSIIENYIIDVFKKHDKTFFNVGFYARYRCRLETIILSQLRLINNDNTNFVDKIFLYGDCGTEIQSLSVKDQVRFFKYFIIEIEPIMAEYGS